MFLGFDLETTGLKPAEDRITEIAIIEYDEDFVPTGRQICTLVNPGIPISEEITEVTNITDEMVADAPRFEDLAAKVQRALVQNGTPVPIIAQNGKFDLGFIHAELVRAGQPGVRPDHPQVDTLQVERAAFSMKLGEIYKRYFGKDFEGAHRADVDVKATVEVFAAQAQAHGFAPTLEGAHEFCGNPEPPLDFAGKLKRNDDGEVCYNFGKHRGAPVLQDEETRSYAVWMLGKDFDPYTKQVLQELLEGA